MGCRLIIPCFINFIFLKSLLLLYVYYRILSQVFYTSFNKLTLNLKAIFFKFLTAYDHTTLKAPVLP